MFSGGLHTASFTNDSQMILKVLPPETGRLRGWSQVIFPPQKSDVLVKKALPLHSGVCREKALAKFSHLPCLHHRNLVVLLEVEPMKLRQPADQKSGSPRSTASPSLHQCLHGPMWGSYPFLAPAAALPETTVLCICLFLQFWGQQFAL